METSDDSDQTFYSIGRSGMTDDGTLEIAVSGCRKSYLWSGSMTVRSAEPDFELWIWILENRDRFKGLISEADLKSIRDKFLLNT